MTIITQKVGMLDIAMWNVLPSIVLLGIQNTDSLSWFCEMSYAFRCSGFSEFWGGENCLIAIQKSNIVRNINHNARVLGNVAFFSGCTYKQDGIFWTFFLLNMNGSTEIFDL